ncbi:hypothetical protein [Roseovarius sp. SCSIO 43702]|nr:hypothetical protein [Roseovarius sp. SCSIO 43702]
MRGLLIAIQAGLLVLLAVMGAHGDGETKANCPGAEVASTEFCDV